jgi:RNA polymerase sigma factor (TIGR02999 family)
MTFLSEADPHTAARLLPLVYDDLRRLAGHRLAKEAPGEMLQPTDLVHDAYLRLAKMGTSARWDDRAHFFGAAAEAMRRILVENARRKKRLKHGGPLVRQDLDAARLAVPAPREDLLALDDALTKLTATDHVAAELVQLRYFGGLTIAEVARILRISSRTANRLWSYARAWLRREMEGSLGQFASARLLHRLAVHRLKRAGESVSPPPGATRRRTLHDFAQH